MSGAHHAASEKTGTKRSVLAVTVLIVGVALAIAIWGLQRQGSSTSGAGSPGHPITAPTSASINASTSASTLSSSAADPTPALPAPTATATGPTPSGPITYVVQPGDNLTKIAAWFKLHGYGQLYEQNKAVIGDNPRLIHPGQRITVAPTGMTTSG